MPFTLTMPKLSPTMEEGTIVKWHKKEGDAVEEGELLFEVATDKATVEYTAIDGGVLRKILVKEQEEAVLNQAVAIFTQGKEESIEGYHPEGITKEPKEPEEGPQAKPQEEKDQGEEQPPPTGEGRDLKMAQPAFPIEPPLQEYSFEFDLSLRERVAASPLAKKLAKDRGLDLSSVKGSGPDGRVMSRDLDLAQASGPFIFGNHQAPKKQPGSYTSHPLTPMRRAIGERLQAAKTFIPHFYIGQDIDIGQVAILKEQLKNGGLLVTFNDFIMRAAALALKEHPAINSGFDMARGEIVHFQTIDIAFALNLDVGLITPIIRHVNYKNLGQISVEVKHLASLAKAGKLQANQYRGGSFTISNLGMFGIDDFKAVINPPQASILAVGGVRECPVIKQGRLVCGKRMKVSLSSDHRVVDGAEGAKFVKTLQRFLESPALLLV